MHLHSLRNRCNRNHKDNAYNKHGTVQKNTKAKKQKYKTACSHLAFVDFYPREFAVKWHHDNLIRATAAHYSKRLRPVTFGVFCDAVDVSQLSGHDAVTFKLLVLLLQVWLEVHLQPLLVEKELELVLGTRRDEIPRTEIQKSGQVGAVLLAVADHVDDREAEQVFLPNRLPAVGNTIFNEIAANLQVEIVEHLAVDMRQFFDHAVGRDEPDTQVKVARRIFCAQYLLVRRTPRMQEPTLEREQRRARRTDSQFFDGHVTQLFGVESLPAFVDDQRLVAVQIAVHVDAYSARRRS